VHQPHVAQEPVVVVDQAKRQVALDTGIPEPGVVGKALLHAAGKTDEVLLQGQLARGPAGGELLRRIFKPVAGPHRDRAHALAARIEGFTDEGVAHPQASGQLSGEGAQTLGTDPRGRRIGQRPQQLVGPSVSRRSVAGHVVCPLRSPRKASTTDP